MAINDDLVSFDLLETDHARVFREFQPAIEDIDDLVDVHSAKAVLGTVLQETRAGVDHEDPLAGVRVFFVDDDDAGWDAGSVKEVGGQTDDSVDRPLRTRARRMSTSALPRKRTPCVRMQAPLPVLFSLAPILFI